MQFKLAPFTSEFGSLKDFGRLTRSLNILDIEFSQLLCWGLSFGLFKLSFPKCTPNKDLYTYKKLQKHLQVYFSQLMNCLLLIASIHPQVASPPLLALAFLGDSNVPPPRLCLGQSIQKTKRWSWNLRGSVIRERKKNQNQQNHPKVQTLKLRNDPVQVLRIPNSCLEGS